MADDLLPILSDPAANWERRPPADAAAVERLVRALGDKVPDDYLAFLRYSDGGKGTLDGFDLNFRLDDADKVVDENRGGSAYAGTDLLRIGMYGGGGLAFERSTGRLRATSYDFDGKPYATDVLADDFAGFAKLMGRWKPKPRRHVRAESADLEAFGQRAFWERFVFTRGDGGVGPEFPELDLVSVDFYPTPAARSFLTLDLDVPIDMYTLFLQPPGVTERIELGWSDEAQWMPYCLRWEELWQLSGRLAGRARTPTQKALPILLLTRFVPATCVDDQAGMRKAITDAWDRLGLFKPAEVNAFVDAFMRGGLEGDGTWKWERKSGVGWVLGGDSVYSLRADGNDAFPFLALKRLFRVARRG